ncbi:MAG: YybS family protein [Clostridia bacterium]|nr:YybS family protein [Clostridia bacterium]
MPGSDSLRVRAMVEGAIAAALATVLAMIGYYLPPLSMVVSLVWFIPIVIVIVRQNMYWGVMSLVVTAIVLMMMTHPIRGLIIILQMGFVALVYGQGFKNQWSPGKIILSGGLVVVISTLLVIGLSVLAMGVNIGEWQQEMTNQMDHSLDFYSQMGLINDRTISEEELRASMQQFISFFGLVIPGILVSGSLLTALVNFLVVRLILKRTGFEVKPIPPFREWQLPWYFIWGIIGGLGMMLLGDYFNITLINRIGINILYIYFPILLISGLAVVTFYYHQIKLARWIKIVIIVLMVMYLPFAVMLLATMGLFDPVFNYRRLGN